MVKVPQGRSWAVLLAVTTITAVACDSSRVIQFDGGTINPDHVMLNDYSALSDQSALSDTISDPCASGGCNWCETDTCPQLCEPGQCNAWAPAPDDFDGDRHADGADNCPWFANAGQDDADSDAIGDLCDVCPNANDPDQADIDGDGMGDTCDVDQDNDGVANTSDNCPLVANPTGTGAQADTDGDGLGDVCDLDADGDGIPNNTDNCPLVANPLQSSSDPNTYGSACDEDADMDNIADSKDNCLMVPNADQQDADGDLIGDVCDADLDGDGVANLRDNCTVISNPDQQDQDRDYTGDVCDSKFCYMVRDAAGNSDESKCLDPLVPFTAYAPDLQIRVGAPVILPLYINRGTTEINYAWMIDQRPTASKVGVINATGNCTSAENFACLYAVTRPAGFVADVPGTYTIKVSAELTQPDLVNPAWPNTSTVQITVLAEGQVNGSTVCIPDKCFN